jgi:Rhs element Vgr protein
MALPSIPSLSVGSTDLTTFTVKVDGKALPATMRIVSLDISRELNRIPVALLVLHDGDVSTQDFELSSGEELTPGKTIEIEAGYSSSESLVFKGVLTGQRLQLRRRGDSLLHLEARHPAFRMTLDRKSRYFTDTTDRNCFSDILNQYKGFSADVEKKAGSDPELPEIIQFQVSDWDFIVARAERLGLVCLARDDKLSIFQPNPDQPGVLALTFGQNIFDMDLEMDARTQVHKVTAFSWDYSRQEILQAEADDIAAPRQGNLSGADLAEVGNVENLELRHTGALKQEELDSWAQASLLKSRFARIRGTLRCQGTPAVNPGDVVDLHGMGDRFNGKAFVTAVRHVLGAGDWETTFQIGLRPEWHIESFPANPPPAAAYTPAVHGLQIGVVTKLQDDPAGEDRIRVRLPAVNPSDDGAWYRVASLDAGEKRGFFFRPEIDDEVVVGFLGNDPHQAIVLGMLNSSKKPAPLQSSDENHQKGLVTRSGIKLIFNDEDSSLTIETPAGNKIVLDDKAQQILVNDQNGSQLVLSQDGISLESSKDIRIKARGDIKVEGMNIQMKANTQAEISASAGVKLNSSGVTEIQGSTVKIN